MTALLGKVNQYADQGCDFSANLSTNANLTGYTAAGAIRSSYDSANSISFTVSIPQPNNGVIVISMPAATTANLEYGRYVYDVNMTSPANNTTRVVEGIFVLDPSATSP